MEDKASTRDQIMAGARRMFAEKGFRASMRDIAQAAGISTTSLIFWYFPDKEALWSAVIQEASPLEQVQHVFDGLPPGTDPASLVSRLVSVYFDVYGDPDNRRILFQMLSHSSQDSVRDVLRRQLTRVMEQEMADWVRRGQQIQAFRQDVPADFLAQAVLGILFALVTRWHVEGHLPWDQEDVIRHVNRLLNDR